MTERAPYVTVVMRAKNAESIIGQALGALYSQDFTDFELLVIDSGSTDRTLEVVSKYPHELVRISPTDYFPGRVLNAAIERVRGTIIVFQNSDAVPLSPYSLRRLVSAFDDAEVQAAVGRQVPRPDADPWVRREYAESFPDADSTPPWITLSLPFAAMRRSAWQRHPFYLDAWASEDTEWGQWAIDHGMKIRYVREAIVMHSHNYTLRQLYGRRFVEGEADAFIYRRKQTLSQMARRTLGSTLRDVLTCVGSRDWAEVAQIPSRRAVYHFAYWRGHLHGARRIRMGSSDTTKGQNTALSAHESR